MEMSLSEEYIVRHKLNTPVVLYKSRSSVLLKSAEKPYRWRIISISWREAKQHPGYFEVNYSKIILNGGLDKCPLKNVAKTAIWYWEQYEDQLLKTVAQIQSENFRAIPEEESNFAAWNVFLMMYDVWFASRMDAKFLVLAERILRTDLSITDRANALSQALKHLRDEDRGLYDLWLCQIQPLVKPRSDWLTRLINNG
jgi:hypothetical protein